MSRTLRPRIRFAIASLTVLLLGGLLTSCEVDSGFGHLDSVLVNKDGTVRVTGWATTFLGATMEVTVVANGVHHDLGPATVDRPDVGKAYPKQGPRHGFSKDVALASGRQQVCAYATGDRGTISLLRNCFTVIVPDVAEPPATPKCDTPGSPTDPVKMVIENTTGHDPSEIFVTLTGKQADDQPAWDASPKDLVDNSVPLSCLPKDPSDPSGNSYTFELGKGIAAGLLWVSVGTPIPTGTNGLPTVQPSTDTSGYVFANVEFAYPGQGDVTNVDQFSIPIDLTVTTSGGHTDSTTFGASTCDIVDGLHDAVADYNDMFITPNGPLETDYAAKWDQIVVKDSGGKIIRVLSAKARAQQAATSPGGAANPFAQGWPDLTPYLEALEGEAFTFEGLFSPAAGTPHVGETGWYSYTGSIADGKLELNGTIKGSTTPGGAGAEAGQAVRIDVAGTNTIAGGDVVGENNLATGIYFQNGRYFVDGVARNGLTNGVAEPAAPNDVYNTIYRDVVTALSYGYPGETYGYDNTGYWNHWNPPEAPSGGKAAFEDAHPGQTNFLGFNLWSSTMYQWSDNYNIPYGENYGSGAVNRPSPLIDVPEGGTWKMTLGKPVSDCTDPALG